MTAIARILLAALAALTLAGCVSWLAPLSDKQVDRNHGTRTFGSKIEDAAIERKVWLNIVRGEPAMQEARLVVTSWNGQVLLAGQVPTDAIKQRAATIAGQVRHVLHVHNELEVGAPIALIARMSDGWITTRVKMRLLFGPDVPGRRVKVVTENGVVYLMGLLTQEEAGLAVNAARDVYGVQKIVKIFEYIGVDTDAGKAAR